MSGGTLSGQVAAGGATGPNGGFAALIEAAAQEGLVLSYWFDPAPHPAPYPVVVRFSGRRQGVSGPLTKGDQFVHDETVEVAVPGSGPVCVTARIRGVNSGEWAVGARILTASRAERRKRGGGRGADPEPGQIHAARWSWTRWALSEARDAPVKTVIPAFAWAPGIIPFVWATTATIGIILALVLQALLVRHVGLAPGSALTVSLLAAFAGVLGAKAWFIVQHWGERVYNGWCIQGTITGAVAVLIAGSLVGRLPLGSLLDATTPALLLGMAVGRVGCFFAGCCYGRPTRSRWGVWSSDQRVGMRRIPTQLMETGLSLTLGLAALAAVLRFGAAGGAIFVAALATYTIFRQGILRLRAERRRSRLTAPISAGVAALVLAGEAVWLVLKASGH